MALTAKTLRQYTDFKNELAIRIALYAAIQKITYSGWEVIGTINQRIHIYHSIMGKLIYEETISLEYMEKIIVQDRKAA